MGKRRSDSFPESRQTTNYSKHYFEKKKSWELFFFSVYLLAPTIKTETLVASWTAIAAHYQWRELQPRSQNVYFARLLANPHPPLSYTLLVSPSSYSLSLYLSLSPSSFKGLVARAAKWGLALWRLSGFGRKGFCEFLVSDWVLCVVLQDDRIVAFQDIRPAAERYLVLFTKFN